VNKVFGTGIFAKYVELTKPKVTLLNLLVAITCFILAQLPHVNYLSLGLFAVVGYLAAGGCGVLNSVYDCDVDKLMVRTSKRSIPAGYVTATKASVLGIAMIATSFVLSFVLFNLLTCLMVILGFVFYMGIYTAWLKRSSPWNVVIGGFAGCFAALSGWTAASNTMSTLPLLVSLLDFLWTPGHLWGLAMKKVEEYRTAKVPMLPVVFGQAVTGKIIFWLNAATVGFSFLLPLFNLSGAIYLATAFIGGVAFLVPSTQLLNTPNGAKGFRVFLCSMPYLACLMIALIVDKLFFV
jgi:protoheme IX farnesyltransferase